MTEKSDRPNRPVRHSIRLKHYDYSYPGYYFITICTKEKTPFFGHITDGMVVLSEIGLVAQGCFVDIPNHFPTAMIDQHIVMPNHVHGIIVIQPVGAAYMPPAELQPDATIPSISGLLSAIVGQYKSVVKRWCSRNGRSNFSWQRGFYEHVVRNEDDLRGIRNYIVNNPLKWIDDDEYIT